MGSFSGPRSARIPGYRCRSSSAGGHHAGRGSTGRESERGEAASEAETPGRTFKALSDRYLIEYARRQKKSAGADERNLNLHVLPKWKERDYTTLRRADVIELIEGILSDGKPVLANRVQALVSVVFSFAVDSDLIDANPCTRLRKRGEETPGERVLTEPEIRLFWHKVVEPPASPQTGLGLRLALLTGVRVGEVAGIEPLELEHLDDSARAVWTIPGNRTKNGLAHAVPLAPMALEIIRGLVRVGRLDLTRRQSRRWPIGCRATIQRIKPG